MVILCKDDGSMYRKPIYVELMCHVTDHVTWPNWPRYNSTNPLIVYCNTPLVDGLPCRVISMYSLGPLIKSISAYRTIVQCRSKMASFERLGVQTTLADGAIRLLLLRHQPFTRPYISLKTSRAPSMAHCSDLSQLPPSNIVDF